MGFNSGFKGLKYIGSTISQLYQNSATLNWRQFFSHYRPRSVETFPRTVAQNELTHAVFSFYTQANAEGNFNAENWRSISSAWYVTPIILSLL